MAKKEIDLDVHVESLPPVLVFASVAMNYPNSTYPIIAHHYFMASNHDELYDELVKWQETLAQEEGNFTIQNMLVTFVPRKVYANG